MKTLLSALFAVSISMAASAMDLYKCPGGTYTNTTEERGPAELEAMGCKRLGLTTDPVSSSDAQQIAIKKSPDFTMAYRQRPALFFPAEMLQCTLHSYYRAKLDPPLRINYGYLTIKEWTLSLCDAGFEEYHVYPVVERHSEFLFGGIVAFK
jgi:hypothetical protein